eukprot:4370702-Prymnesium_polylepis.2
MTGPRSGVIREASIGRGCVGRMWSPRRYARPPRRARVCTRPWETSPALGTGRASLPGNRDIHIPSLVMRAAARPTRREAAEAMATVATRFRRHLATPQPCSSECRHGRSEDSAGSLQRPDSRQPRWRSTGTGEALLGATVGRGGRGRGSGRRWGAAVPRGDADRCAARTPILVADVDTHPLVCREGWLKLRHERLRVGCKPKPHLAKRALAACALQRGRGTSCVRGERGSQSNRIHRCPRVGAQQRGAGTLIDVRCEGRARGVVAGLGVRRAGAVLRPLVGGERAEGILHRPLPPAGRRVEFCDRRAARLADGRRIVRGGAHARGHEVRPEAVEREVRLRILIGTRRRHEMRIRVVPPRTGFEAPRWLPFESDNVSFEVAGWSTGERIGSVGERGQQNNQAKLLHRHCSQFPVTYSQ